MRPPRLVPGICLGFMNLYISAFCTPLPLKLPPFFCLLAKGQLISECLFGVFNFSKKQRKICQISAPESKKWSNHKLKAL